VTVAGGVPTLTLNDGGTATYTGGSGTSALIFSYTVGAGQNTASLAATAINMNGAAVTNGSGNAANFSLTGLTQSGPQIDTTRPSVLSVATSGSGITAGTGDLMAGKVVTFTLNLSEAVTVAGGTPTLKLNDGGVAFYKSGSGSNVLTFSYTVGAGQNTADLAVTAVNMGRATVKDRTGNAADLSGAVTNPPGTLQIDTTAPTVSSVATSGTGITAGSGILSGGNVVTLTLNLSEAVNVAGGTPTLKLNDGGIAFYKSGSGTNALTFSYTVAAGQNTADLAVKAINLGTATVKDRAGNAANLSGAVTNPAGTLQIATTGSVAIGAGQTVEIAGAYSGTIAFMGATGTLKIDNTDTFSGKIGGQLALGDVIDLANITAGAAATIGYSGNNSPGTLTVSDGTHTASIALLGNYSLANFTASSDGHGGTSVIDPPLPTGQSSNVLAVIMNDPGISAINQQLALLSQHMASAFPSSAFGTGGPSMVSPSELGGGQQLAQPITRQQYTQMAA
jgi:hypothetical protein